jgi:hypothetical protein
MCHNWKLLKITFSDFVAGQMKLAMCWPNVATSPFGTYWGNPLAISGCHHFRWILGSSPDSNGKLGGWEQLLGAVKNIFKSHLRCVLFKWLAHVGTKSPRTAVADVTVFMWFYQIIHYEPSLTIVKPMIFPYKTTTVDSAARELLPVHLGPKSVMRVITRVTALACPGDFKWSNFMQIIRLHVIPKKGKKGTI